MSIQAEQLSLVLTRRLADGTIEWIPLESPQHVPAAPESAYALIDRGSYQAPETLTTQRKGDDLIVEVQGAEVLVVGGFFATADAAFYPTPDIVGGSGPFSGTPLTPDSPMLAGTPEAEPEIWSAEPDDDYDPGDVDGVNGGGGVSPMVWVGGAAAGLGLAAAAGGGGGSSGSDTSTGSGSTSTGSGSSVPDIGGDEPPSAGDEPTDDGDEPADTSPPKIISSATANAIDENSSEGQVVYKASATDTGTVTWSLQPGDDAAAFDINPISGDVTLIENPDFEAQRSYTFTVVATDDSNNSSQQTVSLAINDVDETAPTVSSVALTGAVGAQNDRLNAGDTVTVTVTMSESTDVDTAGGTPRIALNVGGDTLFADYVSGSGTNSLNFNYTVQPGDTDNNGIRIRSNSLELNGGALTDAEGNAANLNHDSVPNNDSYKVDTTAPTLGSSSPADDETDVPVGDDIVLTFSENVQIGSGNIRISDGVDTRVIDVTDGSRVRVDDNQVTIDPGSDLNADSTYGVQIDDGALTDQAGNAYAGISNRTTLNFDTETSVDTGIVVFDLVQGSSSDHSDRTFQNDVSYDIYIRVQSEDAALSTRGRGPGSWDRWEGADNLGSDDRIILVGDGEAIEGPFLGVNEVSVGATAVAWETGLGFDAGRLEDRSFTRVTGFDRRDEDDARLFDTELPADFLGNQGGQTGTMYLTDMPAGILTSQGLV